MFTVVDGALLRGFSFLNADRLVSVDFVDPSSASFAGFGDQVTAMGYEELRAMTALRAE
jgi:hypothetical protein